MIFTALTFNVGLLEMLGRLLVPTPYVAERLAALPNAFRDCGADIILLQEIYRERHRRFLADALSDVFPHAAYIRKGRFWGLENGLMILSKHALTTRLELFRDAPSDERIVDHKGVLIATVKSLGLTLFNFHTTAGGLLSSPEAASIDAIRTRQIGRILALADAESVRIPIVAGDLNAGPGVSDVNYRLLARAGYVDVHEYVHGETSDVTWDPRNLLNRRSPHRTSPRQRIDHVFVRKVDINANRVRVVGSTIAFIEPMVGLPRGGKVTLSDHYALLVQLDILGT